MKTICLLLFASLLLSANPNLFREQFADPATRAEAIATLTPKTRDHYFYTALDHQLNGRQKEYNETIAAWQAASRNKKKRISDSGLRILENRRILQTYDADPKAALTEMTWKHKLDFDAAKPGSPATDQTLPTSLDLKQISAEAFQNFTQQQSPQNPYTAYEAPLLYQELNSIDSFSEEKIRWFARHYDRNDHPRAIDLVAKALQLKPPVETSEMPFESFTVGQLDELKKSTPSLLSNDEFHKAYLRKLTPSFPTELDRHPQAHAAFLAKCKDYALKLPLSQISLKAHILYHHLRLQEQLGQYPLDDFVAYLALPRLTHPIIVRTENAKFYDNKNRDFSNITQCPDVPGDPDLIESYLAHFLGRSDEAHKPFIPHIREKILTRLHAKARLLAGANPQRWASALTPNAYQSLSEETRISFAPTAHEIYQAEETVSLPVDLKNTPSLLVRIYAIDQRTDSPSASIDLDGLVPHHTRTLTYGQAPLVLHRETISLPELKGAGTWIVEFVADRVTARALICKGNLTPFANRTADGQLVRAFDEASRQLTDFSVTLGDETFTTKDGSITIPNAGHQPATRGTLTAGALTVPIRLESRSDSLNLETTFFLDREQLLADTETPLHFRTRLTNHGKALPLDRIKNPTLILKAHLHGGVTTERAISDIALAETNTIPIFIPGDLLSLGVTLTGTVTSFTSGESETLSTTKTYQLNGDLKQSKIGTFLFSPTSTGHLLSLLGRNGEPLARRQVSLDIKHHHYKKPITFKLRTDDSGIIQLGDLPEIKSLTARSPDATRVTYRPPTRRAHASTTLHVQAGRELRIPIARPSGSTGPNEIRFHRILGPAHRPEMIDDLYPRLSFTDKHIVTPKLEPGSYLLVQDDGFETEITVFPADSVRGDLLVTADRILPLLNPPSPTIAEAKTDDNTLTVRVANASPQTRVTLVARRYQIPGWDPGAACFPFPIDDPDNLTRAIRPSRFLTKRILSDETRYILDRRNATTFPGTMLPRPGTLLHRWSPEDIDQ